MAYVLYLVGLIAALLGGYLTFSVFRGADAGMAGSPYALALLGAATPGMTLFVIGILLLAAGEALVRLADISRNTARAARAMEEAGSTPTISHTSSKGVLRAADAANRVDPIR